MDWRRLFTVLVMCVLAMVPTVAIAGSCPSSTYYRAIMPDGRVNSIPLDSTTDVFAYFWRETSRSYCIEIYQQYYGFDVDFVSINGNFNCGTAGFDSMWKVRTTYPPSMNDTYVHERFCGISPIDGQAYFRFNSDNSLTAQVTVSETTLYNPRWSTYNGFLTSWGFQNTTHAPIDGVLYVNDGLNIYTKSVSLPADKLTYVFSNDATLALGSDKAGSATFAHDGPPGSVKADCYYAKSGVMVPSSFEPIRESTH